ncbi:DNA repair protein RecO [Chitinophagaceae bacterium IBVUCB1]|nr:DNA repair protein RecO [Chitinophagaceae bacterium IBVUCB1]
MLQNTRGIALRAVKYGDTSIIATIFTEKYGVQSYMVQGVRTSKSKNNKAALLQPTTLLDMVVYHKPQTKLQRIKEYQYAYIYTELQQEIIKNSIALFSTEVLLRVLPEEAQMPELFDFTFTYYQQLDVMPATDVANFPLYFLIQCSKILGYEISGTYTATTPYLNMQDGAFTSTPPHMDAYLHDEDAQALSKLLEATDIYTLKTIVLNAEIRNRLLDWYIAFMHSHTQHMGSIKSLAVLRAILH